MLIKSSQPINAAEQILSYVGSDAALIFIAEKTPIKINGLIKELNDRDIKFMGGIFPKIIIEESAYEEGIVVKKLCDLEKIQLIKNLSYKNYNVSGFEFSSDEKYTVITFVDGLTTNISHYLEKLYETFGMQTNYLGGGAGSLSLTQQPCVFTNDGIYQDAAVFSILKKKSNIGVSHGWKKINGPFVVTKAKGNLIQEINWKQPFQVYKKVVEEHSGREINKENFFSIAKGYPFGILKDSSKYIVRDPLKTNDKGELICVGELENNMVVDILYGEKESLIDAAKTACEEGLKSSNNIRKAHVIDCISRVLFLEKGFDNELQAIKRSLSSKHQDIIISGALTLGEISSYGNGFIEFYNKTVVIGLIEHED